MLDGLCPTTPPRTLPPELRLANQRRLDEFERICREPETQRACDAAVGSSDAVDENADATIAVPDTAVEAPVATPGAADENAGTPTATLGTALETTVAAPGAAEGNAGAANTALDVAANINSVAPSTA
eukprot:3129570-Pleurochrysis_carterae.AAC.1